MRKQLKQVKQFHETFGALINEEPELLNHDELTLRCDLIQEELDELYEAGEFEEDMVEVADAISDLLYVVYGTAISFGLQNHLEDCFDEVHRSNMSKTNDDGSVTYREDGKVLKPESYEAPDLESIVLDDPVRLQESTTVKDYWAQGEIDTNRELLIRMFVEKHKLRNDDVVLNREEDQEENEITFTVKAALI